MILLKGILYGVRIKEVIGSTEIEINNATFDSRNVGSEDLFIAVKGTQIDGHDFISSCIESGAIAIICEELPKDVQKGITYIKVEDCPEAMATIASNYYDVPSEKLKLIGVTGTNGKTTVVTLLQRLFIDLGYKVGLISTVVNKINDQEIPSTHTTPDAFQLNLLLNDMVEDQCSYCFMEVSSHAIVQNRVGGLKFIGSVFTNISHDHLDYHKTFQDYINAKKSFFDHLPATAFVLYNSDDKNGEVMVQNTKAAKSSYGIKSNADFKARILENDFSGLQIVVGDKELWSQLIGEFNVYNILVVYAVASVLGEDELKTLISISKLPPVEGRFQHIKGSEKIRGIVDYAHTPDALESVLKTISKIRTGDNKIITVIGCGGNRDTLKRPLMAKVACEFSNKVIFTSDNPREENPEEIIEQMKKGVNAIQQKKTLVIIDRKEAIKTACTIADEGDIVLVAGKGHEKYQEIKGEKFLFNDVQILEETIKMLED